MTADAACNCDDSKRWRARALSAELSLRFARSHFRRVLAQLERALDGIAGEDLETLDGGCVGSSADAFVASGYVARPTPDQWAALMTWMASRLAKDGGP